jgi:hypothetical protein
VSGDPSALQLTDLHVKTGPATVTGEARLLLAGKPRIDVALSGGEILLDGFLSGTSESRAPPHDGAPAVEEPRHGVPANATDRVSAAPRTAVLTGAIPDRWSHEPRDLSWLNRFDAALKLDAKALIFRRNRLDGVSLGLDLANGVLSLQRLAAQAYSGKLTGDGHLSANGGLALQLALAHAQMRDALLGTADIDVADGTLDAEPWTPIWR